MVWRHILRRPWRPVVSARAWQPPGCLLHVLPAQGAAQVEHHVPVPAGACPVSGNPLSGEVVVRYQPTALVAEVVSLHQLVVYGATPTNPGTARNVEGLAAWLHRECGRALGVPVEVELTLHVRPGPQVYKVTFRG